MPSPYPEAAAARVRSESATRREIFIARQLAGLRAQGFDAKALAREETLLRGGQASASAFATLLAAIAPPPQSSS